MANALQIAGSTGSKQTRYAPILVHKIFKGYWPQRNPFSDAGTTFLVEKFYSGTSFDGMIDGLNVEVTSNLTLRRRCGSSQYNTQTFPAIQRFYEFRRTVSNVETIQVMADTSTIVYDATGPSTKATILTKSAGAGQTSFLGVGNTLFMGNGVDQKKYVHSGPWVASTQFPLGYSIVDPNGNLQYLTKAQVGTVTNVALTGNVATITFSGTNFFITQFQSFIITGLSTATFLNNQRLIALTVNGNVVTAFFFHVNLASTADSGTATTTDIGTLGANTAGVQPTWNVTVGSTTNDGAGLLQWVCYGPPVFDWTPAAPLQPPQLIGTLIGSEDFWRANAVYNGNKIMDSGGFIQAASNNGSTGAKIPSFLETVPGTTTTPAFTADGGVNWAASVWLGKSSKPVGWAAGVTTSAPGGTGLIGGDCIVDTNGNLQMVKVGGTTGGAQPTWNTALNGNTTDNTVTWTNLGPYLALAFNGWKYGYAFHCIDGTVTTISPLTASTNGVLAGLTVTGNFSTNPQVDQVWIFRTADGGSTPLYLIGIPNNTGGGAWTYADQNSDQVLDFELQGAQNGDNNGPVAGFLPDCFHLGRVFGHVGNTLYYSAGADAIIGNGRTAFPIDNNFVLPSLINKVVPLAIGALIFTTSGCYFSGIGGINLDVPTQPVPFMDGKLAGLMSVNAIDLVGSTIYMINSKKKGLQIDIGTGAAEIGFPIGNILAASANPATMYVAYHEQDSTDTGLYLASPGAATVGSWYRMNPAPAPENGVVWAPLAISQAGFSAMQSIETSPGVHNLLMGPPAATGPILQRDTTHFSDNFHGGSGLTYTAYADIGAILLAHPGQLALLDFISTYCTAVGTRPAVSVLLDELGGHTAMGTLGALLNQSAPEPPENGPFEAQTVYNDRWWLSASNISAGVSAACQHLTIEFAWPAEDEPNELLMFGIFGAHYQEI